jgi:endoglucanase
MPTPNLTPPKTWASAQRWLANILGTNSWGSSFIVGDGSTFPNCIQHQVANLAGALDGTKGGTPIMGRGH